MIRHLAALVALLLSAGIAQAQIATSGPGAAQIAMQAAAGASCPVAVSAPDPADKATFSGVFGPACTTDQIAAANAALAGFSLSGWQGQQVVTVTSTLYPALNGTYSAGTVAQAKINAVATYIATNSKFPAGQTVLTWYDTAGAAHSFPTPAEFLAFASAVADFTYAVLTGGNPSNALPIP